jgi:DNA primase
VALIAEETILEVKRSVDITEIVGGYFPLKRAGTSYKALCPFHEEKTPSFNVHPERQTYKCFGCGKGGDAIAFVMSYENVDYPEAIRILAERSGIQVKYKEGAQEGIGREDLYRLQEWAQGVFQEQLRTASEAGAARDFLRRRGVSDETIETFKLGYSMDSWDALLQRARKSRTDDRAMISAGLAIEREGRSGCYDRFRRRVMFPIHDARGRAVGFGARMLREDDHPKFLNSPETALFSKGRGFYGLHLAKETFEQTRTAYIVEGYLDVVVPYQAGVKGLIATLGTALTKEHLKVLRRYVDKVVLVFDSDAAGQKASERGLDLLLSENLDLYVAELPPGMDPDDVVVKQGPDALRACLEKPREIFDFLMASLERKHASGTPAAQARIIEDAADRIALVPDPVKRDLLLHQLALRFGVDERAVKAKAEAKGADRPEAPAEAAAARPLPGRLERQARELLACLLADPEAAKRARAELPAERFPTEGLRKLAALAYELLDRTGEISARDWIALLQDGAAMELAAEIVDAGVPKESALRRAEACLEALGRADAREESKQVRERLKRATPEEETELLRKVMEAKKRRPRDHGLLPGR